MTEETFVILLLNFTNEKRMNSRAAPVVKICEMEGGECRVSKPAEIKWIFRRFKTGETSLEDEPMSGRDPSTMNYIVALHHELMEGAATTNKYSPQIVG